MAFKDANGKITIDEVAAQKDIAQIEAAVEHFESSVDMLSQIINLSTSFSGETGKAIIETTLQIQKQVKSMIDYSLKTKNAIGYVVKKYEEIDKNLKNIIDGYYQS